MERFRAHEKEFKKKQFSKKALLSSSGRRGGEREEGSDCSDADSDYGEDYGDDYDQEDPEEEDKEDMLVKDKEWLVDYLLNIKVKI
jgi:CCR4-NOT transcriptional regulation complex NOT5 subunit